MFENENYRAMNLRTDTINRLIIYPKQDEIVK